MRKYEKLKGHLIFSVLLIISLTFLCGIGEAAKIKLRVKVPNANIRSRPTTESAVVSKAPLGAILDSDEKVGNWYKVNLPPDKSGAVVSGYVHYSIVEIIEEIEEITKEEKVEEIEFPPKTVAEKETIEKKEARTEQPDQVSKREPTKKMSFRAGLGISFPTGDWSDLFKLGIGLNIGNSYSIVRQPMFDIDLLGNLEAHIFLRKAGYTDINWTRFLLSGDCRFNLRVDPITIFAQGGLGLYLDVLEIITWWWKEEASKFKFGPRIGGGIALRNLEIMAMYHMVEDNMFSIMGSVVIKF